MQLELQMKTIAMCNPITLLPVGGTVQLRMVRSSLEQYRITSAFRHHDSLTNCVS